MASTTAISPQQKLPNKVKETAVGFVIGGLAACGAVTFTNPVEASWTVVLPDITKASFSSTDNR